MNQKLKKDPAEAVVLYLPKYAAMLDGDILAALMLSQIHYWYSNDKSGKSKLRVYRAGRYWLAKSAPHWREELGFSAKQSYRALSVLKSNGLIETRTMKFDGSPTTHISLTPSGFAALNVPTGKSHLPCGSNSFSLKVISLTETTAETSAENTASHGQAGKAGKVGKAGGENSKETEEGKNGLTPEEIAADLAMFNHP